MLTSKCAWRLNGVQFFISHLARCLRTRRFSEPTFRPSGATNHGKNTVFRDFPTFRAPASSFFWLFLFSDLLSSTFLSCTLLFSLTLPISAFHLSILSEVWLLNFLRQLQLQLHYTTLHPAVVVRWPLQPLQPLQKKKRNSKHLSVHEWIRSAIRESQQPISPIGFLCLKLLPPPCAALLVYNCVYKYIYIYFYLFTYLFISM